MVADVGVHSEVKKDAVTENVLSQKLVSHVCTWFNIATLVVASLIRYSIDNNTVAYN